MRTSPTFAPELRERAVRMVASQWAGLSTAEAQRAKELEREARELRKANEILKLGGAFQVKPR